MKLPKWKIQQNKLLFNLDASSIHSLGFQLRISYSCYLEVSSFELRDPITASSELIYLRAISGKPHGLPVL
jgi:hypothetical protein